MPKILIITDNLPNQINGVVTTYRNIEPWAERDGFIIEYIHPGIFKYIDCPKYNEVKLAYPRHIGDKIKEINPDYIHIATEGPLGLFARIYLTKSGINFNTAYHTKFPEGLKKLLHVPEKLTWSYIRWFHKHSGQVLTTTDSMVYELKNHGISGNVISWTRGVNRNIFNSSTRQQVPKDTVTLLCVSRVSKEKSLEKFLDLKYPNARKIMIGDGPMLNEYKMIYKDVEFLGFKTGLDLAEYYANADVFVFPSSWETFGIVMIEAMACGTPVAAFPATGPKDVIDQNVTGFMDHDLSIAIDHCLKLDRNLVEKTSLKWSWNKTWEIFKDSLI